MCSTISGYQYWCQGYILGFICFVVQLLHQSARWYANGTLSPMRGISLSLYPPIPRDSQRTATTPRTSCPALFWIVCGFFNVPQWSYINMKGTCETGPTVYRPYPRRLESLTICWFNHKGSTFYSVILRPWVLVQPESDSRPPAWQPDVPPLSHRYAGSRPPWY